MKKEVLFLLGDCPGYYVPLMYRMAEKLKTEGATIIVASTSPYYEKYNGINFSQLGKVYYFSDYIKKRHKKSKLTSVAINYWHVYPSYVRDKFFFGRHKNNWNQYKKLSLFFKSILASHSLDLVVSEPPSNAFIYMAYTEAQKLSVQFLGFMPARIPKHVNVFMDQYGECLLENQAVNVKPIENEAGPPDYMLTHELGVIRNKWYLQLWRMIRYANLQSIETGRTSIHQIRSWYTKRVWRKLRFNTAQIARVFSHDFEQDDKVNIFFPLHYRPEASTSVLSKYYENDLELLKNISFSLPNNTRLIVKEHSAATGMRDLSFYRELLSFPNIVLLGPDFNFLGQIKRFDAAIVLTSTAGFEAIQEGIPVFLLGRTFYSSYPGIINIDSPSQLEDSLRELTKINHFSNGDIMHDYQKYCFEGQFNYMSPAVLGDHNVERLLAPIRHSLTRDRRSREQP